MATPNSIPGEDNLIAPLELRELRRVFDYMCLYADKKVSAKVVIVIFSGLAGGPVVHTSLFVCVPLFTRRCVPLFT